MQVAVPVDFVLDAVVSFSQEASTDRLPRDNNSRISRRYRSAAKEGLGSKNRSSVNWRSIRQQQPALLTLEDVPRCVLSTITGIALRNTKLLASSLPDHLPLRYSISRYLALKLFSSDYISDRASRPMRWRVSRFDFWDASRFFGQL